MEKVFHVQGEISGILEFSGNDMVFGGGSPMGYGARDFAIQLGKQVLKGYNMTHVVAKGNVDSGHADECGNYSGVIGILQRNEADSAFFPTTINTLAYDPVLVGAPLIPAEAMIATVKQNDTMKEADVLGYFQSVSTLTYLYFLMAYYVVAVLFSFRGIRRAVRIYKKTPKHIGRVMCKISKGFWHIYSATIEQNYPNTSKISIRCLWGTMMLFTIVITEIVFSSMNVDMIVPIKGQNVEILDDLLGPRFSNLVPVIFKSMPLLSSFKYAKGGAYESIWKRCILSPAKCLRDVTYLLEDSNDSPLPKCFNDNERLKSDEVIFTTRQLSKAFLWANCFFGKNLDYYHQSSKNFQESVYAIVHSKKIDSRLRYEIDDRYWKVFEAGLFWAVVKEAFKAGSPTPYTYSVMRCHEGIIEVENQIPEGISFASLKRVFGIWFCGFILSFSSLTLSIFAKTVKMKLRVRKNIKLWKVLRKRTLSR